MRDLFAQNYASRYIILDEINNFLGKYHLPNFTPIDIESENRPISIQEIDSIEKLFHMFRQRLLYKPSKTHNSNIV